MFIVFTILIAPTANASSSGMNFIDTTMSTATDAYTNSVTISLTIIQLPVLMIHLSSYIIQLVSRLIQRFDFGREVFHIDFSPDGQYIVQLPWR